MPPEPLRLTLDTLARYRAGAPVAVEIGALASIPRERPRPYLAAFAGDGPLLGASAPGPTRAATAILPIRGALTQYATLSDCGEPCSYEAIEAEALALLSDPGVGRLVIDIDSNGGDVPGLEDCAARLRKRALEVGKVVLAHVPGSCMSAAYWLVSVICADPVGGVFLSSAARVGAIGACVVGGTDARRYDREGTDHYVARRPAGKFRPNPVEPFDDLGMARMDALADESAVRFFAAVESARGIPAATVEAWNAGTFTGAAAVAAGLAGGVGRLEEIVALAESWPTARAA